MERDRAAFRCDRARSGRTGLLLRTPAKVNLGLRVLGRRPDGYHQIRTVLAAVDLWDTLSFVSGGAGVRLECDDPDLPADETNLVLRAAALLSDRLPRGLPGVRIRLRKAIPAGRGFGGGSSDAAATLLGLNRLFRLGLGRFALHRLLGRVGMDAPFFLYGGTALATGRGDQVFPIATAPAVALVLLIPDFAIPTPEAYRGLPVGRFCVRQDGGLGGIANILRSVGPGLQRSRFEPARFAGCFRNDLERSAALPAAGPPNAIPEMRSALLASGAVAAAMSGSGSAVFGLFPGRVAAERAASRLSGAGFRAVAARTISREEHLEALVGSPTDGAWPRG